MNGNLFLDEFLRHQMSLELVLLKPQTGSGLKPYIAKSLFALSRMLPSALVS